MFEREGLIVRSISGFHTVKSEGELFECGARGIFRKKCAKPVVGDRVIVKHFENFNIIDEILPRKNFFLRPALANLDLVLFVVSTCEPNVNYLVLDRLIAIAEFKKIDTSIIITKTDMASPDEISNIYNLAGINCIFIDNTENNLDRIYNLASGKISALCGNSGVGKSTLLNKLLPELNLKTDQVSLKLGRGKHTTKTTQLFSINDGFIADTPGFSTVDILKYDKIEKENLIDCFREFKKYSDCKFKTCTHTFEKGCLVRRAVEDGLIHRQRYRSYCFIYNELKNTKY